MQINYKQAESKIKPVKRDSTSSPNGVYFRRNIKEIETINESGEKSIKYTYDEAYLNTNEAAILTEDLLVNQLNGEPDTPEYEIYKNKLNTGVLYTNGFKYKPKYISDYKKIMSDIKDAVDLIKDLGGDPSEILSQQFAIYDETGKPENMVMMSGLEVIKLYFYLYSIKEQYFAEYKKSVAGINTEN